MRSPSTLLGIRIALTFAVAGAVFATAAFQLTTPTPIGRPIQPGGIYRIGERAGWTFSALDSGSPARFRWELRRNNAVVLRSGHFDLAQGQHTIEVPSDEPSMMFLQLTAENGKTFDFGAAIAPERIMPAAPRPKDFDVFWARKLAEMRRVPPNPRFTAKDSGHPDVEYGLLSMDHVAGTQVHGQIARPKRPGKFPAMLVLLWASPPYPVDRSWILGHAAEGWLVLNIQPHNVLPAEPPEYYRNLPEALRNYAAVGQEDRERNAFVEMYLRGVRAADFLAAHPNWDGKTLLVTGTSMGGQQSFAVAGLHERVTHMIVNVPAGCDLSGPLYGRQNSYPFFPADRPRAVETAAYIDATNFAPRITATSLVAMGFVDTACAPAGIWAAYNLILGVKEVVPMFDSPHNHVATPEQQRPFVERSQAWMAALAKGEKVPPPK